MEGVSRRGEDEDCGTQPQPVRRRRAETWKARDPRCQERNPAVRGAEGPAVGAGCWRERHPAAERASNEGNSPLAFRGEGQGGALGALMGRGVVKDRAQL